MKTIFSTLVVVIVLLLCYMTLTDKGLAPPIKIDSRNSILAGKVLRVYNESDTETLFCGVRVHNKKSGERKSWAFQLAPHSTQEIGLLEMGWSFEPGEKVEFEADRYMIPRYYTVPK